MVRGASRKAHISVNTSGALRRRFNITQHCVAGRPAPDRFRFLVAWYPRCAPLHAEAAVVAVFPKHEAAAC